MIVCTRCNWGGFVTFRDGIPETFAIEIANWATQLPPAEFVSRMLEAIAIYTPWKSLAYYTATARHGYHFRISNSLPNDPADAFELSWTRSPIALKLIEAMGEPVILADVINDPAMKSEPTHPSWGADYQLVPAAIIASTGAFPGLADGLTIFQPQHGKPVVSSDDKERLWQLFTAIRLGLKICINTWIKSESSRMENKTVMLVDKFGYFLASDQPEADKLRDYLDREAPELLINGRRIAMDTLLPKLKKAHTIYLKGLEVEETAGVYKVSISRNAILATMSPREREIATLIAEGKSYKSIGSELGIALSTVSNISVRIRAKLGLTRKEEIATLLNGLS